MFIQVKELQPPGGQEVRSGKGKTAISGSHEPTTTTHSRGVSPRTTGQIGTQGVEVVGGWAPPSCSFQTPGGAAILWWDSYHHALPQDPERQLPDPNCLHLCPDLFKEDWQQRSWGRAGSSRLRPRPPEERQAPRPHTCSTVPLLFLTKAQIHKITKKGPIPDLWNQNYGSEAQESLFLHLTLKSLLEPKD